MKYKYKFKKDIEAIQFKGDSVADLIKLNHFLGETPEIIYPEGKSTPYFITENTDGKMNVVRLSDFIMEESPGNYIAVPYKVFTKLYKEI